MSAETRANLNESVKTVFGDRLGNEYAKVCEISKNYFYSVRPLFEPYSILSLSSTVALPRDDSSAPLNA